MLATFVQTSQFEQVVNIGQSAAKGGVIKGGVHKRAQTRANADFRLPEMGPKTLTTQADADKCEKMQIRRSYCIPPFTHPFCDSPNWNGRSHRTIPSHWMGVVITAIAQGPSQIKSPPWLLLCGIRLVTCLLVYS